MIKLFTDTSANLPVSLTDKYSVAVVPFTYTVNGESLPQHPSGDFNGESFYEAMRQGSAVKTSMVNAADFTEAFEKALSGGDDVLYVGMSGGISGTAQAASFAAGELKEKYPERKIAAIDTLAASLGEGLQVLEAARMIRDGAGFEEVRDRLLEKRNTMCQYFTVDDLKYLKAGGRISSAAAVVGTLLQIKPLLTGDAEGRIVSCGKARGRKAALTAIADKYAELCADKNDGAGIAHADSAADADFLENELRSRGFTGECLKVMYEPVTGSHVGPGTVALFFNGIHK